MNLSNLLQKAARRYLQIIENKPHRRIRRSANRQSVASHIQQLERRILLSLTSVITNNVLTVSSDGADAIVISRGPSGNIRVNGQIPSGESAAAGDVTSIQITGGAGDNVINLAAVVASSFPNLKQVTIDGAGGQDTLWAPNVQNNWSITSQDAGIVNSNISFSRVENLVVGTAGNTFDFANSEVTSTVTASNVSGTIAGRGGVLTLKSTAPTSEVRLFNHVNNPGNIEITADSIIVGPNVTVSSRKSVTVISLFVGTQTFTTGDSGQIKLTAPSITLGTGSKLDASVSGAAYKSGNID